MISLTYKRHSVHETSQPATQLPFLAARTYTTGSMKTAPPKPLPELMSFLEGLPEPHILFDTQYRTLAAIAAYRPQFSPDRRVVGRNCYSVSHHFSIPCV